MDNITARQYLVKKEIKQFKKDNKLLLSYLIDLGERMPSVGLQDRKSAYLVDGCLARVWLVGKVKEKRLYLYGHSDAAITKGLVSLLIRIFSGETTTNILQAKPLTLEQLGLDHIIGIQRSHGFEAMNKKVKQYALDYRLKNINKV